MGNILSSPAVVSTAQLQDHHTPRLVLHTLRLLNEVTKHLENDYEENDRRWEFLRHFRTAASILYSSLRAIKDAGMIHAFAEQIQKLAILLEGLLDKEVISKLMSKELEVNSYPRLYAVCELFPEKSDWKSDLRGTQLICLTSRRSAWRKIQLQLFELSNELQQFGDDLSFSEPPAKTYGFMDAAEDLRSLAESITSALECHVDGCVEGREARLRLSTFSTSHRSVQVDNVYVLIARESPAAQWHELCVHNTWNESVRVGFHDEDDNQGHQWRAKNPKSYTCICEALGKYAAPHYHDWHLNIVIKAGSRCVQTHELQPRIYKDSSLQGQLNLKSLLAASGKGWSRFDELMLAVVVSYSLFYLYGGSWAHERWSRRNIVFFSDKSGMPLRPFLSADPQKQRGPLDDPNGSHQYPELLELGVILLEIHLGESLESFLKRDGPITEYDELWLEARKALVLRKLHIESSVHRKAIERCLTVDFSMSGECDADAIRNAILTNVVRPLEDELMETFRDKFSSSASLDTVAEEVNLAFLSNPSRQSSLPYRQASTQRIPPNPSQKSGRNIVAFDGLVVQVEAEPSYYQEPQELARRPAVFELFGSEDQFQPGSALPEEYKATKLWKEQFAHLVGQYFPSTSNTAPARLKLAILDSGYDGNHSYFFEEPRIKGEKSWVSGPANKDTSGHGTHIAGIILDLTRNVDLYIARVTTGRYITDMDGIADAIKHAREEWEVDIISVSFGLKERLSALGRVRSEIQEAIRAGILIFAAANNDGGHRSRTYPAKHGAGVFCVHSATGEGNKATYNPTARSKKDNFMVVGDCIGSAWPSRDDANATRYMSGTSFATPVAVAICAFMIGFVRTKWPKDKEWARPPETFDGMRELLEMMSGERDSYDWINFPGYFMEHGEAKILSDIEELLND